MNPKQQTLRVWLWMQKHWIVSTLALLIGSCAFMTQDRTVTWEEEVPLNTGETVVVKRTGTYSLQLEAGNPFNVRLSPEPVSTIEFTYKGKQYVHTDEAMLLLLAIGPDGVPNFAALPDANSWQWKNNYYCTTPSYVQFKPNQQGTEWKWPPNVESWLYGLPTNLIRGLIPLAENGKRFPPVEIHVKLRSLNVGRPEFQSISANYAVLNNCPRRN